MKHLELIRPYIEGPGDDEDIDEVGRVTDLFTLVEAGQAVIELKEKEATFTIRSLADGKVLYYRDLAAHNQKDRSIEALNDLIRRHNRIEAERTLDKQVPHYIDEIVLLTEESKETSGRGN